MSSESEFEDLPLASRRRGLSKGQKAKVIDGVVHTVGDATAIARTLLESATRINEIRAQGRAEVDRIDAETRQIEVQIAGLIEVLVQDRRSQESRGAIVVQVITEVTRLVNGLPDSDETARRTAIAMLPGLVESALKAR